MEAPGIRFRSLITCLLYTSIRKGISSSLKMGGMAAAGMLVLNVVFGRQMIQIFLESYDSAIVEYGYIYLVIIGVFSIVLCTCLLYTSRCV